MRVCPRIQKGLNPDSRHPLCKKDVCLDSTLDWTPASDVQTMFLDYQIVLNIIQ